jgi:hypothetical protein
MAQQGSKKTYTAEDILKEAEARIAEKGASQTAGQTGEQATEQATEQEKENLGYLPVPPPCPLDVFSQPCQRLIREDAEADAVPVEVVVAALLSAGGGCIGRTRG